jgi:MutS domain V
MLPLIVLAAFIAVWTALSERARRKLADRVRADWGSPHVQDRKMDAIAEYYRSRAGSVPGRGSLDDRTWNDLDMDQVFAAVDRTESTLGQQALYYRLRSAPVADNIDAFESLVNRMGDDWEARERMQMALGRLRDPAGYDLWWLAQPGAIERQPWHIMFPIAALTVLVAILATPIWHGAALIVVTAGVINLVVRGATAPRVRAIIASFRQIGPLISAAEACRFLTGRDVDSILGCLDDELPRLRRLKLIASWAGREPSVSGDIAGAIVDYLNLLFLLDVNAVYFGAGELNARGASLLRVIAAVGEIDAALSVASFRKGAMTWTRPQLQSGRGRAVLTALRHPLVEEAVPNSITLCPPHGVLVTGSNMSGKSTFIRTLGVNAVLAQTINTCLATEYQAPVFAVRTCIGRSDDLLAGKSYYLVEVEAVLALVEAASSTTAHLFLFDELFRGTNAVERIAAAEAVLTELLVDEPKDRAELRPHVVVAATHDGELVELLRDTYASYHFEDTLGPQGLSFEFWLKAGPATSRNAIELLRLNGAPPALVERALARAATLDRQRDSLLRNR